MPSLLCVGWVIILKNNKLQIVTEVNNISTSVKWSLLSQSLLLRSSPQSSWTVGNCHSVPHQHDPFLLAMIRGPKRTRGSLDLGYSQTTCLSEAGEWDVFSQGILDSPKWLRRLSGLHWSAGWASTSLCMSHLVKVCVLAQTSYAVLNPVGARTKLSFFFKFNFI